MTRSNAKALYDVIHTFEFLLSMVIWHDIFYVNVVSKALQSPVRNMRKLPNDIIHKSNV
jgi:hypothetical protein